MSTDTTDGLTIFLCPPTKACDHLFDGPEVPVSSDPNRPGGYTTTCSKCGARAIDVHLWTLP